MRGLSFILLLAISLCLCVDCTLGQRRSRAGNTVPAEVVRTGYHGPVVLGPLSINNRVGAIEFNKLLSILGNPVAPPGEYVCYHNAAEGTYLVVERGADDPRLIRGLTLSRINICPAEKISQASGFSTWATGKGIRLGSAAKDVLSKYGEPSSVWDVHTERGFVPYPREGDRSRMTNRECILVYLPKEGDADTSHAFFGIRNGVVAWVTLSDNE